MKTCQPSINETKHPGKKRGGEKGQDWRTQVLAKCYFSVYYYYLKGFPQNKNPKGLFIPSGGDPRIFICSCVPMRKRVNYMLGGSHTCEFLMRFRNTLKWPFPSFPLENPLAREPPPLHNVMLVFYGQPCAVFLLLANFCQISSWKNMISTYTKDFFHEKKLFAQIHQISNFLKKFLIARVL